MANILTSNNNIFKSGSVVFTSGDDLPPPSLDINPNLWLGYTDGQQLTSLTDSSGNGIIFTQSTSGKQGLFKTNRVNGLPTFLLDGVDDVYLASVNPLTSTIFIVVKSTVQNQIGGTLLGLTGYTLGYTWGGENQPTQYFDSGGSSPLYFGAVDVDNTNNLYVNNSGKLLSSQVPRQTYFSLLVLDVNIPNPVQGISVIGAASTIIGFFSGEFARILTYSQRLTSIQRITKTNELLATYAL